MKTTASVRLVGPVVIQVPRGFAIREVAGRHETYVHVDLAPAPPPATSEHPTEDIINALTMLELELDLQEDQDPPRCAGTLRAAADRLRVALAKLGRTV